MPAPMRDVTWDVLSLQERAAINVWDTGPSQREGCLTGISCQACMLGIIGRQVQLKLARSLVRTVSSALWSRNIAQDGT
jgi:hypothetical protein